LLDLLKFEFARILKICSKQKTDTGEEPQITEINEVDGLRPAFSRTRAGVNPRRCLAGNSFTVPLLICGNLLGLGLLEYGPLEKQLTPGSSSRKWLHPHKKKSRK
jgi:hypothetical protein